MRLRATRLTAISNAIRNLFAGASLDLNFAGATALDPRITFTRASGGTYFDSAGVLRSAATNYIRNNTMQGAVAGTPGTLPTNWFVGSTNGLTTNVVGTGTEAGIAYVDVQITGTPSSTAYTLFTESGTQIAALNSQTWASSLWCRIVSGSTTNITTVNNNLTYRDSGGVSVQSLRTAMTLSANLSRYTQAQTATIASTAFVHSGIWISTTAGAPIDITLRIGMPQLELGAFATSVIPTSGTINSAPRFDHDPVTLQPRGLLIEEQRTNLLVRSAEFDNASWTKQSSVSVAPNVETAPDGTLTASRITADSSFGLFQSVSVTVGASITQSVYLKAGTATRIMFRDFNGAGRHIVVNPATGAIVATAGTLLGSGSINCGNGWFRVFFSYTADAAAVVGTIRPDSPGAGQTFILWGAQTEVGAFPTSYTPTAGTAATRAADVAVMTGTNFSSWYRQDEGTLFVEYSYSVTGVSNLCAYSLDNGTANETIVNATATPNIDRVLSSAGGVSQANFGNFNYIVGQVVKRAVAVKLNDAATTANGSAVATDNSYTMPVPTQLTIGAAGYFTSSRINGHIRRIAFFPRRLSNAELQSLTA